VSGVMEELRRITTNERSENQNLCDSPDFAKNRLTANRFYKECYKWNAVSFTINYDWF